MMRDLTLGLGGITLSLAACSAPAKSEPPEAGASVEVGASEGGGASAGPLAATARVDATGRYEVVFADPAWTFAGELGVAPTRVAAGAGTDGVGPYHEVTFAFADPTAHTAAIRAYDAVAIAKFSVTYTDGSPNPAAPFPTLSTLPALPFHVTFGEREFAPVTFTDMIPDSPFVFFDDAANAFIVSAASHFNNAATTQSATGAISSGIDPAITTLPPGHAQETLLVADRGIGAAFRTWGSALLGLSGKARAPNDATPELERLGYWTDSHAYYFYRFDKSLGYLGTLLAVRDYFAKLGVPLAYMQLDSWWYPKGDPPAWEPRTPGAYLYEADSTLFPKGGLAAFEKELGLPMIVHAKWIVKGSPYYARYAMSKSVSIDPRFWDSVAAYIAAGGVTVYEQDFLNGPALPLTTNLFDQDAYFDNMARAMDAHGIGMQYCMPMPKHYLESTRHKGVLTSRVSGDGFRREFYEDFFYSSLLAGSVGNWPWSDAFMSSVRDSLLLSTLSAGMVGVGDAIGAASVTNLLEAVRPDGVIVKPDAPIVPLDATFLRRARGIDTPVVAATYSDFGGGERVSYVYAFNTGASLSASFSPAMLGYSRPVWVHDGFGGTGRLVQPSATYTATLTGGPTGSGYWVVAPVGPSGIALLGDRGKFVSLGKKRFTKVTDDGTVGATLSFAKGEGPVTLHGYAAAKPSAHATVGSVGPVTFDASTKAFTVVVSPAHDAAEVTLR